MRDFDQDTSSKRPGYGLRVEERQARDYCKWLVERDSNAPWRECTKVQMAVYVWYAQIEKVKEKSRNNDNNNDRNEKETRKQEYEKLEGCMKE